MDILVADNLKRDYKSGSVITNALRGVSFSIEEGSFTSIIGRSGSGKTTLLNILGGLDEPTDGKVILAGQDIYAMKDRARTIFRRRKIGIIFQSFNLVPEYNVMDNICLPTRLDHKKPDKKWIEEILERLEISNISKKYPAELSGGEQQRVAVARAVSNRPSILLADEPTGNLDTKSSEQLMDLLIYSNRHFKQTILLVTHNKELALRTERIIRLEDGMIISDHQGECL